MSEWEDAQTFEASWWGSCLYTYGEETKQLTYADRMGLEMVEHAGQWPVYDLEGKNVLDVGGGPCSMLLKCVNRGKACYVVDPLQCPDWVRARYDYVGIYVRREPAERVGVLRVPGFFAECWIYNVLQHVQDPERVIALARENAKLIRIFEWIDMPAHEGHPHELRAKDLIRWLGGEGGWAVEDMNENGCHGTALYGVFTP